MTAATLFTPQITPELDDTGLDNHATIIENEGVDYDDAADDMSEEALIEGQTTSPESAQFRKLQKKLRRQVSWAIRDFNMIEDGDVVMVCVSGGKDSYTLLDILLLLKRIAPISFDIVAVNLDQKQPGYPEDILPAYLNEQGIAHYILEKTLIAS